MKWIFKYLFVSLRYLLFNFWRMMIEACTNQWEVYIIQAKSGKLYTGITNNIERRFAAHHQRQKGARFFYFSEPDKIVFRENCANRSEASKREIAIKKMKRPEKLALIKAITKQSENR